MDWFGLLALDELSHGLANLSMFPYFDVAHYVVSIMALREQPGENDEKSRAPRSLVSVFLKFCFGPVCCWRNAETPVKSTSGCPGVSRSKAERLLTFLGDKNLKTTTSNRVYWRVESRALLASVVTCRDLSQQRQIRHLIYLTFSLFLFEATSNCLFICLLAVGLINLLQQKSD